MNKIDRIMTTSSAVTYNKSLVERFNKEFFEDRQLEAYRELVSPDFINHAAPPGKQGYSDTLQFFQQVLWPALPDVRPEVIEQIGEGDRVVSRKVLHATLQQDFMGIPATNSAVQIKVIDIFRITDGKLMEHWGMIDMHDLMSQVGNAE